MEKIIDFDLTMYMAIRSPLRLGMIEIHPGFTMRTVPNFLCVTIVLFVPGRLRSTHFPVVRFCERKPAQNRTEPPGKGGRHRAPPHSHHDSVIARHRANLTPFQL